MRRGLLSKQSRSLARSNWYDSVRDLIHEDPLRQKLMEITFNNHRLLTIGLEMKMMVRLMLENIELHEYLFKKMNELALEAADLIHENENNFSICSERYSLPRKIIRAMKKEHLSSSVSAYKSLFKGPTCKLRRLDRKSDTSS